MDNSEIYIKKGSSLIRRKLIDIIYIEAGEGNITLYTSFESFTVHSTMTAIENQLPAEIFVRVHPSFIVNKSMIQTINENTLALIAGSTLKNLPIDNKYCDLLRADINTIAR